MECSFEMNEFCILCLNIDVKLHKLNIAQAIVIENILKLNEFDVPWENQCHQKYHVCTICLALLLKISNFMKMILNAQKILSDLSKTTDTITKHMLKSIDRCTYGLNPLRVVSFGIFDDDEKMYHNQNTHQNKDVGKKTDCHVQECIKNFHTHKPDYNSTNKQKIIELHSSSDEDLQEPLINIILENELIKTENNPLEAGNNVSKNKNTINDSFETIKKQSIEKKGKDVHLDTKSAPQKIVTVDPGSPDFSETESSSETERQQNENGPLEAGNKVSKNNNTTNDSLEAIKKKSKQKKVKDVHLDTKTAPQKIVTVEPESPYFSETESSSKTERQQNEHGPLEAGNKVSKNNNTTNDSLETIKKQSKQKKVKDVHLDTKAAPQKIVTVDPESPYFSETESLSEIERQQNKNDDDYQPDSTQTDSEDSDDGNELAQPKKCGRRRLEEKPQDLREYPRKCDHCDHIVIRKRVHYLHYLQEHRHIEYPYGNEKNHMCSICGKLLMKRRVKAHERSHYEGHYKCFKCPKVFSSNLRRTRHQYTVHGKNVHTCDYCSKSFKTKHDMKRHIRLHTGEKPFKCHICGAGFAHSGNRSIHIRNLHQHIKNAPKKVELKKVVRKNKKSVLTDTESESSGEQLIAKKRKRSRKQQNSKASEFETEIEPASKKQSKERAKRTQKKLQNKNDTTRTECGTRKQNKGKKSNKQKVSYGDKRQSRNRNCQSDNFIEASDDSDDECLAEKKKRHNLESNKVTLHEEETAKGAFSLCRND